MGLGRTGVGEAYFTEMVVRAGRAFVAAKGKNPIEEGGPLAEYLRSERPLGADERQMLADLVTGDWRNRAGRKEVTPSSPRVIKIVKALRKHEADGMKKEAAKMQVASDFGVARATVENYERMTREREEATEKAKRPYASPNK
jgi:hypothetical protein